MSIARWFARNRFARLLANALLLATGVTVVAFSVVRLVPGDAAIALLPQDAPAEAVEQLREDLGLNDSLPQQFFTYVGRLARGDFGVSLVTRRPVVDTIARTMPVSAALVASSLLLSLALAVPIGVVAAIRSGGKVDRAISVVSTILLAIPSFFVGLVLLLVFSLHLGIAPVAGFNGELPAALSYLALPSLTIACVLAPILARVVRSSVLETLDQEFVESAIVRGLPSRTYLWGYVLRPSAGPLLLLAGFIAGSLLSSTVIVELVFDMPGIGSELLQAVTLRDYTMVQGITFVFGMAIVLITAVSETIAFLVDPRLRRSVDARAGEVAQ